ncbi:hypothetical protein ACES2J_08350 [Bdellovibrio bacteriovorus]|uniref:hypothetical protein n=1 Tax=Bdellovibrio bacteriovorus TaxID=959 RepID=UPI0035A5EC48
MSQVVNVKAKGLITSTNQISQDTPEGALSIASNVVIDNDNTIQSRRGFERVPGAFADVAARIDRLAEYQGKIIAHRSNDNVLCYHDGATWTEYAGTYSHPDPDMARIRFADMNGNQYFTASDGIKMLDAIAGPIYSTGIPKGLEGTLALTGASGFMTDDTQVAYRVVWGTRDANNNLYLGAPSQRIITSNSSGGTRDVVITFTIPSGITTSDFFQVYRSGMSATASTEPNDEMQVVYEANPTGAEITAKTIVVTDSTPDSMRGAFLYTNANQEGITEENNEPPLAKDIAQFKNFMFFADVSTKQSLSVKLIAVGGTQGLVLDDTITIDSMVFTAKASEAVASREFELFTGGSASQNIDDTARSLVKVINQYSGNTSVYAYYTSGYTDLPGQILIERRSITGASFSGIASRATAWDIANAGTSSNSAYPNGIMWSKIQQPEHVPYAHLELVGNKGSAIRRIMALRDSLFILKDDGVFRLTGSAGSWQIEAIDTSTRILAPDSAVILNNQIYCLTDQGIVSVSDIGVQVISRNIEDQLNDLLGLNYEGVKKISFGISYETDRKYVLYTVSGAADTFATQAFIYNTFTQAWTTWDKAARVGIVNKTDNLLYIAQADTKHLLKERKTYTFRDYIDEELDGFTVSSFADKTVVLNTVSGLEVGDLLYQSSTINSPIISIDSGTNAVTVYDSKPWTVGAITVNKAIDCHVEWANQHCGNPGVDKLFQEVAFMFKKQSFVESSVGFYTDMSGGYEYSSLAGMYGTGVWGASPWGTDLWGGVTRPKPIRVFIPREKSRGTLLVITFSNRYAYSEFVVQGLSLQFDFVSERLNRS